MHILVSASNFFMQTAKTDVITVLVKI